MNRNRGNFGDDLYGKIMRGVGVVLAIALWGISMRFSVAGFQITVAENAWVGIVFALTVTYFEILVNRSANNRTILLFGMLFYAYGIATNFVGIRSVMNADLTVAAFQEDWFSSLADLIVVLLFTLGVEIVPEHIFIYCLRDSEFESDLVTSLQDGLDRFWDRSRDQDRGRGGQQTNNQNKKKENRNQQNQQNRQTEQQAQHRNQNSGRQVQRENADMPIRVQQPRVVQEDDSREIRYPVRRE